jgi:hypothetical protein
MKVLSLVFALIAASTATISFNNAQVQAATIPSGNLIAQIDETSDPTFFDSKQYENIENAYIKLSISDNEDVDRSIQIVQEGYKKFKTGKYPESFFDVDKKNARLTLSQRLQFNKHQFFMIVDYELGQYRAVNPSLTKTERSEIKAYTIGLKRQIFQQENQLQYFLNNAIVYITHK